MRKLYLVASLYLGIIFSLLVVSSPVAAAAEEGEIVDSDSINITTEMAELEMGSVSAASEESTDAFVPLLHINSVNAKEGEDVLVPVSIENNYGICGATVVITYDSALRLTSAQAGSAFNSLIFTKPGNLNETTLTFLWDGLEADDSNGDILILTFQAPAQPGSYEINAGYEPGDYIDGNLNDLDVDIVSGVLTVSGETAKPDLILPNSLTYIGEEAFMGGTFTYPMLSENVVYIGKKAFADCQNLARIYIPAETEEIEPDAFEGVEGLVICGVRNSYAETFAVENGFTFEERTDSSMEP